MFPRTYFPGPYFAPPYFPEMVPAAKYFTVTARVAGVNREYKFGMNNVDAVVDPTVDDDCTVNRALGCWWFNRDGPSLWHCNGAEEGAADWVQVWPQGDSGEGWGTDLFLETGLGGGVSVETAYGYAQVAFVSNSVTDEEIILHGMRNDGMDDNFHEIYIRGEEIIFQADFGGVAIDPIIHIRNASSATVSGESATIASLVFTSGWLTDSGDGDLHGEDMVFAPSGDWDGTPPADIGEALNRLAALVKVLNSGVGP